MVRKAGSARHGGTGKPWPLRSSTVFSEGGTHIDGEIEEVELDGLVRAEGLAAANCVDQGRNEAQNSWGAVEFPLQTWGEWSFFMKRFTYVDALQAANGSAWDLMSCWVCPERPGARERGSQNGVLSAPIL